MNDARAPRVSAIVTVPPDMAARDVLAFAGRLEAHAARADDVVWVSRGGRASWLEQLGAATAASIMPEVPATDGRGDAMWRGLGATSGGIVVWLDAAGSSPESLGPIVDALLADERAGLMLGPAATPEDRGVGELLARPLFTMLFPELAGLRSPASRTVGGRRSLLQRLPFFSGDGVEAGLVLDAFLLEGARAIREVAGPGPATVAADAPRAAAVAQAIFRRAEEAGRIRTTIDYPSHPLLAPGRDGLDARAPRQIDRPPLEVAPTYLAALRGGVLAAARSAAAAGG